MAYVRKGQQPKTATIDPSVPQLVSFDLGNGFSKGKSAIVTASYPSVIAEALNFMGDFSLNGGSPEHVIGFEGQHWAIGNSVRTLGVGQRTIRDTSRIETQFYRVLFAAMLARTLPLAPGTSVEVAPVLSLPPGMYYERERLKAMLANVYEVDVQGEDGKFRPVFYNVPITGIRVIPEGMGTVCLLVLDEQGREGKAVKYASQVIGVVDAGTLTTDFIMLDSLKIVRESTRSTRHGLNDIATQLIAFAGERGILLEEHETDDVLKRRYLRNGADRIPVDRLIQQSGENLAELVNGQIRTLWRGGQAVERIILTGGGAPLIYEHLLGIYGKQLVLAGNDDIEPAMANAVGGYRYGLLRRGA